MWSFRSGFTSLLTCLRLCFFVINLSFSEVVLHLLVHTCHLSVVSFNSLWLFGISLLQFFVVLRLFVATRISLRSFCIPWYTCVASLWLFESLCCLVVVSHFFAYIFNQLLSASLHGRWASLRGCFASLGVHEVSLLRPFCISLLSFLHLL